MAILGLFSFLEGLFTKTLLLQGSLNTRRKSFRWALSSPNDAFFARRGLILGESFTWSTSEFSRGEFNLGVPLGLLVLLCEALLGSSRVRSGGNGSSSRSVFEKALLWEQVRNTCASPFGEER